MNLNFLIKIWTFAQHLIQGSYAFSKKLFPDFPLIFIYNMLVSSLTSTKKVMFFPDHDQPKYEKI